MHDVHAVLPARTLHIFVQNGVGGTLFLPFRIDGQQSLHLLHHDEVSIFVYDFSNLLLNSLRPFSRLIWTFIPGFSGKLYCVVMTLSTYTTRLLNNAFSLVRLASGIFAARNSISSIGSFTI